MRQVCAPACARTETRQLLMGVSSLLHVFAFLHRENSPHSDVDWVLWNLVLGNKGRHHLARGTQDGSSILSLCIMLWCPFVENPIAVPPPRFEKCNKQTYFCTLDEQRTKHKLFQPHRRFFPSLPRFKTGGTYFALPQQGTQLPTLSTRNPVSSTVWPAESHGPTCSSSLEDASRHWGPKQNEKDV